MVHLNLLGNGDSPAAAVRGRNARTTTRIGTLMSKSGPNWDRAMVVERLLWEENAMQAEGFRAPVAGSCAISTFDDVVTIESVGTCS